MIITRKEAREKGLTTYFTGRPCKHGHISKRTTSNGTCLECALNSDYHKKYLQSDKSKQARKRNNDKYRTTEKGKATNNRFRLSAKGKVVWRRSVDKYQQTEKGKQAKRRYDRTPGGRAANVRSRFNCRAKINARNSARRAAKLQANPIWYDEQKVRAVYEEAAQLTSATGIPHEVHHIIPLLADDTCQGLHTHHNLIILTEGEHRWFHAHPQRLRLLW